MNKTEEIIKVAIEGGYNKELTKFAIVPSQEKDWKLGEVMTMLSRREWLYPRLVNDPLFWQAIGKAKGWNKNKWIEMGTVNKSVAEFGKVLSEEKYHALRFHEINLSDPIKGWDDAINYLYELIK